MRVLHLCAGNLYGGIERMLVTLAKHSRRAAEVEHELACCFDERFAGEIRELDAPCHVLGAARISRPWTWVRPRRALSKLIRQRGIDVVISHGAWPHALLAPVARRRGAGCVFWLHDPPQPAGLSWLEKLAARHRPALVIGNSEFTLGQSTNLLAGVARRLIRCPVEDGTPADRAAVRSNWRAAFHTPDDDLVILQVGRWERHKGHLCLLDALSRLRDIRGWTYWHAGVPQRREDASYCDEVRARAAALGIANRTQFLGWVDNVETLYCAADVYCQPNVGPEPFGLTFVEALYSGLPVVATAQGGPTEIVGDDSRLGALVPVNDPAALAETLRELIASPLRRQAAAEHGPRRARLLCDPIDRLREVDQALRDLPAQQGESLRGALPS